MRVVVARNLEGRGVHLHPQTNLIEEVYVAVMSLGGIGFDVAAGLSFIRYRSFFYLLNVDNRFTTYVLDNREVYVAVICTGQQVYVVVICIGQQVYIICI